jgi:prepilin-type N-terminal cleavage/methylation domain-containing protein
MISGTKTPRAGRLCSRAGFSLIELLVAVAITASVITTAVMIYQNLVASGGARTSYGAVDIGASLPIFYGEDVTSLDAYFAPSYGRAAAAELVRDQFIEDLQSASAVFCLGRNVANTIHPTEIEVSATLRGSSLDSPNAFRSLLASAIPASASIFTAYRGASMATNASIFILKPSAVPQSASDGQPEVLPTLKVLAVYDIDLTPATSLADPSNTGTYVSVKRYQSEVKPTHHYDVFYAASSGTVAFKPLVVCFERSVRRARVEGNSIDRLKQAAERPFYFIWWPDPAAPTLEAFSEPEYSDDDPRASYAAMGGRTAFFFAVPMFPSL